MSSPELSIVVTVVSGAECLRRCLSALSSQVQAEQVEVIVPWDEWCADVGALTEQFPFVRFLHAHHEGITALTTALQHRLYDRRRAKGLAAAKGRIVAMTEDHAVPAADWCANILQAHAQPFAAIGGAIDNQVDRALNWAWYYCDFGRYGRPLISRPAEYVSDVNVSYKREALAAVRDVWAQEYHETNVHWTMQQRGFAVVLDPRPVVYQHRPSMGFAAALAERVQWGRVFAQTRLRQTTGSRRALYALGTSVLPFVLSTRALGHMLRQRRSALQILRTVPALMLLLCAWSWGECLGYLAGTGNEASARATVSPS